MNIFPLLPCMSTCYQSVSITNALWESSEGNGHGKFVQFLFINSFFQHLHILPPLYIYKLMNGTFTHSLPPLLFKYSSVLLINIIGGLPTTPVFVLYLNHKPSSKSSRIFMSAFYITFITFTTNLVIKLSYTFIKL